MREKKAIPTLNVVMSKVKKQKVKNAKKIFYSWYISSNPILLLSKYWEIEGPH